MSTNNNHHRHFLPERKPRSIEESRSSPHPHPLHLSRDPNSPPRPRLLHRCYPLAFRLSLSASSLDHFRSRHRISLPNDEFSRTAGRNSSPPRWSRAQFGQIPHAFGLLVLSRVDPSSLASWLARSLPPSHRLWRFGCSPPLASPLLSSRRDEGSGTDGKGSGRGREQQEGQEGPREGRGQRARWFLSAVKASRRLPYRTRSLPPSFTAPLGQAPGGRGSYRGILRGPFHLFPLTGQDSHLPAGCALGPIDGHGGRWRGERARPSIQVNLT